MKTVTHNTGLVLHCSRTRGVVSVEFALTAMLFFIVFFAALEFSRAKTVRHTIDNAVYEGARRGIVPGATSSDVDAAATKVLQAVLIKDAIIQVTPQLITPETEELTVSIQVPLNSNFWAAPLFFDGHTLSRSLTMQREKYVYLSPNSQ